MRVVADAGCAPGVCACAWGFLFWSKLCVHMSPLADLRTCLALRAAVAGFSHSSVFLRHEPMDAFVHAFKCQRHCGDGAGACRDNMQGGMRLF